jgi:hypothetical protein
MYPFFSTEKKKQGQGGHSVTRIEVDYEIKQQISFLKTLVTY